MTGKSTRTSLTRAVVAAACLSGAAVQAHAQDPASPRAQAPIDLTGYWASVVHEDWRFRMVVPPKGDYPNIPLNAEGRKVADAWDPAKEPPDSCRAFGAPNIMRQPGRLHITWADAATLRIETDAGLQTRLLRFGAGGRSRSGQPQWQGESTAEWEGLAAVEDSPQGLGQAARKGALRVVTTRIRPGYLQANGVPYSGETVMTEYFDVVNEPNGDVWLVVKSVVEDPRYLTRSFIRSTHFKKQAGGSGWNPSPCR